MQLSAFIWNVNPIILPIGDTSLKFSWYGLLWAASFFCGYVLFVRFFKKEKINTSILDKLAIYMVIGTVLGARLGHCLIYEPEKYINPNDAENTFKAIWDTILEIGKVYEGGLASHGAAIGILIVLGIFVFKHKWNFIWLLDRIAIVVALSGLFIRAGNLMNSEIYGIPTQSHSGFVYSRDLTDDLIKQKEIKKVQFKKVKDAELIDEKYLPVKMIVHFDAKQRNKDKVEQFTQRNIPLIIESQSRYDEENVKLPVADEFEYTIRQNGDRTFSAIVPILTVPRHPTHIYEALSYFLIFLLLLYIYYRSDAKTRNGLMLGLFFFLVFAARFFIEIIKEEQVEREVGMALNLGQKLSLPFIGAGIVILILSFLLGKKKAGVPEIATTNNKKK